MSTHTPCNFGCQSRANFQWKCNATDCHPSFPVDPVDHHATSTFTTVFVQKGREKDFTAFHRCQIFLTRVKVVKGLLERQPSKHQCWPASQLPDCVSRSHQSSKSHWQSSSSSISAGFFCTWPIRPLYFCPKEKSPLIQIHVTSLSPHRCTVGPSSLVWMMVSAGPRSLGVFSSNFPSLRLYF